MKNVSRWFAGLIAVVAIAVAASGAYSVLAQQDAAKKDAKQTAPADAKKKAHDDRMAAYKKAFLGTKTTLAQAITAAESSSKGKAYDAAFDLPKSGGKPSFEIGVFIGDQMQVVSVDADSGKVTGTKKEEEEGDEGDEDDEE